LNEELEGEILYPIVHIKEEDIEVAITHSDKSQTETYFSFVNGQNTTQGGTHLNAFREAYVKTIREFFNKNFEAADVRKSIIAAFSINVEEPVFESQTKTKLGSNDIGPNGPTVRTFIIDFLKKKLDDFLHKNPEVAEAIQRKIIISERRKELSGIQKLARERAKKVSLHNKKLRDCRQHYNDQKAIRKAETQIFITEGDSASGSITKSRDVETQAVFR
jgi:topoisomerase-4 subunit B